MRSMLLGSPTRALALVSSLALSLASSVGFSGCELRAAHRTDDPALSARIGELTQALLAKPDDLDLRRRLADAHLEAEHWFVAAEIYKQIADVAPQDARALAGLSDAYLKLAYYTQAYQALSRGVTLTDGPEECMLRLGLLLRSDGSPEGLVQARRILQRFVDSAPGHSRLEEARSIIRQLDVQIATTPGTGGAAAPTLAPAPTSTTAAPAGIPEHQGASGDEKVGALNPFGAAIGKALEAVRASDAPAAEKALLEALSYRPDDVGALALLAETYLVMKRPDDALKAADKAYATDPRDTQARWAFGLVHVRTQGDMAKALEAWRSLVRDDPEFARQAGVTRALEEAEKMVGGLPPQ